MNQSSGTFTVSEKKKKETFIAIFQLLKHSSSQIHLNVNAAKLHIQGMDKSHVCLFDLTLDKEWFDQYNIDKNYQLCFDTSTFCSIITTKSDEQKLYFLIDDTNNILNIQLIDIAKTSNEYGKYFKLPLLEYDYEEMYIPSVEYDVEMTFSSKKISDVLSQLSNFGDDLFIKCSDESIDFISSRDSIEMCVKVIVEEDDISSYSIAMSDNEMEFSYSLTYINKMCVTNKLANQIEFNLSKEYPMKIYYDLGNKSSIYFYIAPKIVD